MKWTAVTLVGIFAVGAAVAVQGPIAAQDHGANGPSIAPTGSATLAGQIRTAADMQAADAALGAAGSGGGEVMPFLSTIDPAEYAAAKSGSGGSARGGGAAAPEATAPAPLAPPTSQFMNWEGLTGAAAGGLAPPDTHGAVGNTQYAQIVNAAMRVFTKGVTGTSQPAVVSTVTLKALFGVPAAGETVFDPRIIYDETWDRWVVVATRRNASAADPIRKFFLAVSRTASASGTWCVYNGVNFGGGPILNGDWWDYPQLGMDLDGLIITGNIFTSSNGFRTTALMPIPKAQVYNCLGFSVPMFTGLIGTLAPPLVRDNNGRAFIISANSGLVRKYTLTNSSRSTAALSGPVTIAGVSSFFTPGDAPQPGTTARLDTLDGRFVNASTQRGIDLWNTHAVATATGGTPRIKWYRINTTANNVTTTVTASGNIVRQGTITSGTNSLFNASIAANNASAAVITFTLSSTAIRAQMRFTGKQNFDSSMGVGTLVAASGGSFTTSPSRWGDYSAVSVDPINQNHFWITNQLVGGTSTTNPNTHFNWRSRMARVGY